MRAHRVGRLAALWAAVACMSFGCGGGKRVGSAPWTPGPLSVATQAGRVELPSGSPLVPGSLTITNSLAKAPVAADGSYSLATFAAGPQFAMASNSSGNIVLLGWASAARPTLDVRTTAEVLLYLNLGAFLGSFESQELARTLLATATEVQPVADAIAAALTAGASEPLSTSGVVNALTTACHSLQSSAGGRRAVSQPPRDRSVLFSPAESRSGLTINTPTWNTLSLTNAKRRRAYAFIDRVSYVPAAGGAAVSSPAAFKEFDVPLPSGVGGTVSTLVDLFRHKWPYAPKTSDPIALPLEPSTAQSTAYRLTVVGVGDNAGDYSLCTPAQWQKSDEVVRHSLLRDYLLPLVLNLALPLAKDKLDALMNDSKFGGTLKDFAGIVLAKAPSVWQKADQGKVWEAACDGLQALTTNGTFRSAMAERVASWLYPYLADPTSMKPSFFAQDVVKAISKVCFVLDATLTTVDSAAQIGAVIDADMADIWTVTVTPTRAPLHLVAEQAEIDDGDQTIIHAFFGAQPAHWPDDPLASGLHYRWTCAAVAGGFDGTSSQDIRSDKDRLTYKAATMGHGTETFTVEAFSGQGSDQVLVGSASCTLTVWRAYKVEATTRYFAGTAPDVNGHVDRFDDVMFAFPKPPDYVNFGNATWSATLNTNGYPCPADAWGPRNGWGDTIVSASQMHDGLWLGNHVPLSKAKIQADADAHPLQSDQSYIMYRAWVTADGFKNLQDYELVIYGFGDDWDQGSPWHDVSWPRVKADTAHWTANVVGRFK